MGPLKFAEKKAGQNSDQKNSLFERGNERVLFFRPDASGLVLFYQEKRTYRGEKSQRYVKSLKILTHMDLIFL